MRFGRIWTMRGPSIWSREPVIEAEFDVEDHPDTTIAQTLLDLTRRLQAATDFVGHIAELHETRKPGYFRLVFDYDEAPLAKACLQSAFDYLVQSPPASGESPRIIPRANGIPGLSPGAWVEYNKERTSFLHQTASCIHSLNINCVKLADSFSAAHSASPPLRTY